MKSNSFHEKIEISKLLLFELVERVSRYYLHLEEIQEKFYSSNNSNHYNEINKSRLLDPYYDCLNKILCCSLIVCSPVFNCTKINDEKYKLIINELYELIQLLHKLHMKLGFLPRPPEPPELKRFGRILAKHSMNLTDEISIYVDEKVTEETYFTDPLAEFKNEKINKKIKELNTNLKTLGIHSQIEELVCINENSGFHVTIPRIDANNSCRWPTLVHELAHRLGDSYLFKDYNIEIDFNNFLIKNNIDIDSFKDYRNINIENWLKECWCDLFGAIVMGQSFWFSQASSFIFSHKIDQLSKITCTHPPSIFRLLLISSVLRHRFKDAIFQESEKCINSYRKIFDYFDKNYSNSFSNDNKIKAIYNLFKTYFIDHFFTKNEKGELFFNYDKLNNKKDILIKYTSNMNKEVILNMVSALKFGHPIPSYRECNNNIYKERPSHVQEVLFASWLYRNESLKDKVLLKLSDLCNIIIDTGDKNQTWDLFIKNVVRDFKQFNYSALRSIQVGEWFDLLSGDQMNVPDKILNKINKKRKIYKGVLSDYEIYELIVNENILIIPLINISKQLGSTSLDIRLGTSFQIYYPNQVGLIDLTDENSIKNANKYSNFVDLDFIESIPIAPGQFILAHSLEYIKLPNNISAELEGRSSFARLGLEIHMTAGFIDPGFQGVLTYEIFNAGPNPINLYPGIRIGQLRFFSGNPPVNTYDKNPTAKYRGLLQHHNSLQSSDYEIEVFTKNRKTPNN